MKVVVNSTKLVQELRLLNRIVPTKPTIPIMAYVLIRAEDQLYLSATNMEVMLSTSCSATIHETGSITLPAKKLLEVLEQLPETDVTIVVENNQARVLAGSFKSRLQTLTAKDFPALPGVSGQVSVISGVTLQSMINRVSYAISDKGPIDGALLSFDGTTIAMVATDGKRVSLVTSFREDGPKTSAVIPSKTLEILVSQDVSGDVEFSQDDRHLFFILGKRTLISRMLVGAFPNYHRVIPKNNDKQIVVTRSVLAAALRRVGLVSDFVSLTVESNRLIVAAVNVEIGEADEEIVVAYEGEPIKIHVNWKYILDYLEKTSEQTITILAKDPTGALLLTNGAEFINVVMVIRS